MTNPEIRIDGLNLKESRDIIFKISVNGFKQKRTQKIIFKDLKVNISNKQWKNATEIIAVLQIMNEPCKITLLSEIITAFRLSGEGGIGFNQYRDDNGIDVIKGGSPYRAPKALEDTYEIQNIEITKDIFKKLSQIKWGSKEVTIFQLALSRFNRSYNEEDEEDVLLDLIICLEVLFASKKCNFCKSEEISYGRQIQKYIVPFLKRHPRADYPIKEMTIIQKKVENKYKPVDLNERIDIAYQMRNRIAHSGERFIPDKNTGFNKLGDGYILENLREFLFEIRIYARNSLLSYLDDFDSGLKINNVKKSHEIAAALDHIKAILQCNEELAKHFPEIKFA